MIKCLQSFSIFFVALFFISCGGNDFPEKDRSIIPENINTNEPTVISPLNNALPQPVPIETTAPAAATANLAGINPAHGVPGHRCDIAVGAPLSTPVTKPVVQPAQTISAPAVTTPVTTTLPASGSAFTGTVNPAHGEPGHNCSIAVGAPLN